MGGRGGASSMLERSRSGSVPGDAAPTLVSDFLRAYRGLPQRDGVASLADLRQALPNASRGEFNDLVKRLADAGRIQLIREADKRLQQRDRDSGISYGGEIRHLIRVE